MEWKCEFQGCPATPKQIEELRKEKDGEFDGFPHYENHAMRVCNLCRRTPLDQQKEGTGLEPIFIQALQEELKALESSKDDLAAVFRYYRRYAKELIAMLHTTVQECFAWEIVPILELVDDLLLYERVSRQRGGFSAEVEDILGNMIPTAWKKVEDRDRKKVAILLRTWRELKVFSSTETLVEVEAKVRSINLSTPGDAGLTSATLLDSVDKWLEESDEDGDRALVEVKENGKETDAQSKPWKKLKTEDGAGKGPTKTPADVLERILKAGTDPFEILDLDPKGATTKSVRKQYRKLCLYIHPDKNPNMDADKCQDALSRVQKAREEAEARLEAPKVRRTGDLSASATMCATSEDRLVCRLEGCNEPPCRQCANSCCVRNITHCHQLQHQPGGKKCFFHPPPRSHARNA